MNPKNIVDNESYIYSRRCIVFVGANEFAPTCPSTAFLA